MPFTWWSIWTVELCMVHLNNQSATPACGQEDAIPHSRSPWDCISAQFQQKPHISFSSVQSISRVRLFVTPWTAACQASLSITNSWSLLKLISFESVMSSSHLILCHPLSSCLQSFPASGSFQMSLLFASGGPSIGASAQHQSFQWIFRTDFL